MPYIWYITAVALQANTQIRQARFSDFYFTMERSTPFNTMNSNMEFDLDMHDDEGHEGRSGGRGFPVRQMSMDTRFQHVMASINRMIRQPQVSTGGDVQWLTTTMARRSSLDTGYHRHDDFVIYQSEEYQPPNNAVMFESNDDDDLYDVEDIPFGGNGASQEDMQRIVTSTITTEQILDDEKCSVCLVEYMESEIVSLLPCSHQFHEDCIKYWLKDQDTCPLCRAHLGKIINNTEEPTSHSTQPIEDTAEYTDQPATAVLQAEEPTVEQAVQQLRNPAPTAHINQPEQLTWRFIQPFENQRVQTRRYPLPPATISMVDGEVSVQFEGVTIQPRTFAVQTGNITVQSGAISVQFGLLSFQDGDILPHPFMHSYQPPEFHDRILGTRLDTSLVQEFLIVPQDDAYTVCLLPNGAYLIEPKKLVLDFGSYSVQPNNQIVELGSYMIDNGKYLLRPSTNPGEYIVEVVNDRQVIVLEHPGR